jgi:hypothetical protein
MLKDYNNQGAFIVFSICFYKSSNTGGLNVFPISFYKGDTSLTSFTGIITSTNANFHGAGLSEMDTKPGFYIYRVVHHLNNENFAYVALTGPNKDNTSSTPDYVNSFTNIWGEDSTYMNDIIGRMKNNNTLTTSLILLSSSLIANDLYVKYFSIDGYVDYLPSNIDF